MTSVGGRAHQLVRRFITPSLRYRVRQRIVETPVLSEQFAKINPGMALGRVDARTRLVIDGFPRSGNSYARAAFQLANGDDVPIATHAHTPRVVALAVRNGIPAIVLIREPRAVVASVLQFTEPDFARVAVHSYLRYYRTVLPLVDRVVIAPFALVTKDFGAVIRACNDRFGSAFVPFATTPDSTAAAWARIDDEARRVVPDEHFDAVVPRPAAGRADPEQLLAAVDPRTRSELDRANELYEAVLRASGRTPSG